MLKIANKLHPYWGFKTHPIQVWICKIQLNRSSNSQISVLSKKPLISTRPISVPAAQRFSKSIKHWEDILPELIKTCQNFEIRFENCFNVSIIIFGLILKFDGNWRSHRTKSGNTPFKTKIRGKTEVKRSKNTAEGSQNLLGHLFQM